MIGTVQHFTAADMNLGMDLARHGARQKIAGLGRDLVLIDMRIGAVADDDVAEIGRAVGHVGVQVERHGKGHVGAHDITHGLQQAALAVLVMFTHHGAVQAQQDAVERT